MRKKFRAFLRKYDEELFILSGFAFLVIGAYKLDPSAAWFVAAIECLGYAFLLAQGKNKK
jgi:hypothetical protein